MIFIQEIVNKKLKLSQLSLFKSKIIDLKKNGPSAEGVFQFQFQYDQFEFLCDEFKSNKLIKFNF